MFSIDANIYALKIGLEILTGSSLQEFGGKFKEECT
jgi:hypothetical protein